MLHSLVLSIQTYASQVKTNNKSIELESRQMSQTIGRQAKIMKTNSNAKTKICVSFNIMKTNRRQMT